MVCTVSAWAAKPMPGARGLIAAAMVPARLRSSLITAVGTARHASSSAADSSAAGASLMRSAIVVPPSPASAQS